MSLVDKIIGTHSERELKRIRGQVDEIEAFRPQMQALTDEELREKYFFRHISGFAFMGRHSLLLYLIHQPIIFTVLSLIF